MFKPCPHDAILDWIDRMITQGALPLDTETPPCFRCAQGDRPELLGDTWYHVNGACVPDRCTSLTPGTVGAA